MWERRLDIWPPLADRNHSWANAAERAGRDWPHLLRHRAKEVVAWFAKHPPIGELATAVRPDSLSPEWPPGPALFSWFSGEVDEARSAVVNSVCTKRTVALDTETNKPIGSARFLVYEAEGQMADGAAELASGGLFDHLDEPGWGTWIDCYHDSMVGARLLCCIPPGLIEAAQAGMDANSMACIYWIDCPQLSEPG